MEATYISHDLPVRSGFAEQARRTDDAMRAAMDAVLRPVPEAEAYLRRAEAALQPDPE